MLRLKLKSFLRRRGLTEVALTDAIADALIATGESVSERMIRYLTQNDELLTATNKMKKPSMLTLGYIIAGLRHLTGEEIDVEDVLEYVPREEVATGTTKRSAAPPGAAVDLVLYRQDWASDEDAALLVPIELENEEDLDEIWEMTIGALRRRGFGTSGRQELATIPATASVGGAAGRADKRTSRRTWWRSPVVSLALLLALVSYIVYDQLVANPRLLERYIQLVSFRDRVRPTSELPVPTLIGPEGEVTQTAPVMRVGAVPGAVAYEFWVENSVSEEVVYSGPVPRNSFPIPETTLCADTTYAWRARALGNDGWTSFSSPVAFRISPDAFGPDEQMYVEFAGDHAPPETPEVVAPIGSTNSETPVLEVTEIPRVLGYGFYIRNLRTDAIVYDNNFVTDHRVQLPEGVLEDGGVYQWNARVRNCHYWSRFTPTHVFTVNVRE